MSVIRPDFYNFGKVVQPQEALKDVVISVIVYFAVFLETGHFLFGIGLIPNHFGLCEFVDVTLDINPGLPIMFLASEDVHMCCFTNSVMKVSNRPSFIRPI